MPKKKKRVGNGSAGAMLGPPGRREYADEKKRVGELSRRVGGADDVVALKMLRQHSHAALAAMPADSSGLTLVHKAASAGNSHCLEHLLSAALPAAPSAPERTLHIKAVKSAAVQSADGRRPKVLV